MMTYKVKEIFKTLQGEGGLAGRVAVFCRFAGCNLWSGREKDRAKAICNFCDTQFLGGKKYYSADALAAAIEAVWGDERWHRMVVLTGGEPALQFDVALQKALRERGFFIAIETNGTIRLAAHADWVCVSPKAGTNLAQLEADELKVVYPQDGDLAAIPVAARIKSIQPMDGPHVQANTQAAIEFCLANPSWRLSLQTHKMVGLR